MKRRVMQIIRRMTHRFRLCCDGCENEVRLRRTRNTLYIDEAAHGWTFTSDRGWYCPECTEVLG